MVCQPPRPRRLPLRFLDPHLQPLQPRSSQLPCSLPPLHLLRRHLLLLPLLLGLLHLARPLRRLALLLVLPSKRAGVVVVLVLMIVTAGGVLYSRSTAVLVSVAVPGGADRLPSLNLQADQLLKMLHGGLGFGL